MHVYYEKVEKEPKQWLVNRAVVLEGAQLEWIVHCDAEEDEQMEAHTVGPIE